MRPRMIQGIWLTGFPPNPASQLRDSAGFPSNKVTGLHPGFASDRLSEPQTHLHSEKRRYAVFTNVIALPKTSSTLIGMV